jgi:hypothetical protein
MKSIKILINWWKKGNDSKMGNQIYFKIPVYVDLAVLIIFTPCQISNLLTVFELLPKNLQF